MTPTLSYRSTLIAVTTAALLWGLYWVPIHILKSTGLSGTVAALAVVMGIAPAMVWWLATRELRLKRRHLTGALSIGIAISLYGAALNFTEVTRVVLLFYLAPAWSILIECRWFNRAFDARTLLALGLFALGLLAIVNPFTAASGVTAGVNIGDAIALVAGICWSAGAAIVFSSDKPDPLDLGIAANGFAILVAGTVAFIAPGDMSWAAVRLPETLLYALLAGCLYVLPITILTFLGAARLAPATLTFLLSAEILSGIASSSYWLGEPFTLAKSIGTVCIVMAVFVPVILPTACGVSTARCGRALNQSAAC
ncbi:MAG: DMT family transporter [Pseudomonadota bacterium]